MSKKCFHDKTLKSCDYCSVIKKIANQTNPNPNLRRVSFGNLWKLTQGIHKQINNENKNNMKLKILKNIPVPISNTQQNRAARILNNPKNTEEYISLHKSVIKSLDNKIKTLKNPRKGS
jgi:hypothetical protein